MNPVLRSASSPALSLISDPECHPSPLLCVQIRRPRSCPPVLSGWRLHGARCGFVQGGKLLDTGVVPCRCLMSVQIHSTIPCGVTRTYEQQTHNRVYRLFTHQSPSSLVLERGGSQHRQRWRSRDHKVETIHSQPDFSGSHDLLVSHTPLTVYISKTCLMLPMSLIHWTVFMDLLP